MVFTIDFAIDVWIGLTKGQWEGCGGMIFDVADAVAVLGGAVPRLLFSDHWGLSISPAWIKNPQLHQRICMKLRNDL